MTAKLRPAGEQAAALLDTIRRFNAACNAVAEIAFRHRTAGRARLHRLAYRSIRERFGLSSQMAVRAIAKAADAYRRDRSRKPVFCPHGAIAYDQRLLSWSGQTQPLAGSLHVILDIFQGLH